MGRAVLTVFVVAALCAPEQPGQDPGGLGDRPAGDPNAVSIFTALQEQLGLRLSSSRDTVEVLVIDTLEHPTPN